MGVHDEYRLEGSCLLRDGGRHAYGQQSVYVGISGATSYFKQTGGTMNVVKGYWGADANTKSRIDISGGVFNASGMIGFINGNSSRIELNVNGGTMNFNADPCFGGNTDRYATSGADSTNIVTISNGGVINVGSETTAKWLKVNVAGSAVSEFNLNEGGTLAVWHIEKVGTAEGSKIVFNGGTLKSLGVNSSNTYIIENDDTLTVEVGELGGIIDVNGHAVQLPKALTGSGTLTITNSSATAGSIAFSANVAGKIRLAASNVTATFADGVTIGGLELGAGWSGTTLPAAPVASYTLAGGTITMAYDAIGTGTNLVLKSGSVTLDMSGVTDAAVGSTTTLTNVSLADSVKLSAITFNTYNSKFDWTASIDDGAITMTAKAPEGPNKWVGGSEGNWNADANWQYGVPETTATVEFDDDATCWLDASKTVSNLVVNASVLFKTTNTGSVHPTIYIKEVNGEGTIGLYHSGIIANGLPGTIAEGITIDINDAGNTDSWLEGSTPLQIYGNITGSGYVIFRQSTWFYGDNSGHTGKVVFQGNNDGRRFMAPESGFSKSSSVAITGSSYFGFTEGTIKFNNLTWNSNGGYRGMNVLNGAKFTVELTGTSAINNKVSFFENKNTDGTWGNNWNNGCATCTIVNKGTLTTTQEYDYTLKCEADSTTNISADNTAATIKLTGTGAKVVSSVELTNAPTSEVADYDVVKKSETVDDVTTYTYTLAVVEFPDNLDMETDGLLDWVAEKAPTVATNDAAAVKSYLNGEAANTKYTKADCFVAGIDPTDENADFTAQGVQIDSSVKNVYVTLSTVKANRVYIFKYSATSLTANDFAEIGTYTSTAADEGTSKTIHLKSDNLDTNSGFFKMGVQMKK